VQQRRKLDQGLVKKLCRVPEGNDVSQIEDIAAGECDVAMVNHYYVARLMQSKSQQIKSLLPQVNTTSGKAGIRQ